MTAPYVFYMMIPVTIILAILAWLGLVEGRRLLMHIARKGIAPHLGLIAIAVAGGLGFAGYACDAGLGGSRPNPTAGLIFAAVAVATALCGLAVLLGGGIAVPADAVDTPPRRPFLVRHRWALLACVVIGIIGCLGVIRTQTSSSDSAMSSRSVGTSRSDSVMGSRSAGSSEREMERKRIAKEREGHDEMMARFRVAQLRQSSPEGAMFWCELTGDHWTVYTEDSAGSPVILDTFPPRKASDGSAPAAASPLTPSDIEPQSDGWTPAASPSTPSDLERPQSGSPSP